ncbi:MAG: alpha/beta fold hydrolase [Bacteroidetes bacterium]|nr:alpha/beta fold hydrolase [Bacteroidota bacterium]
MDVISGSEINIKIGDATICYDDFGTSEIPIIFIHGFPFNKETWQPQVEFLRARHRVIAYDIRGFGKSTSGKEESSIGLFADDLIDFMDALQIKKAIVCGLSMGGYILLNAAHRYPERFEVLVLCDTQCNPDTAEGREKRFDSIKKIEAEGLGDYADASVKNLFCKNTFDTNKKLVSDIHETILTTSPSAISATLSALANRSDTCPILSEISLMTLIICGKEDVITPPAKAEILNTGIKNSSLVIIEEAGHLSNLEQVDEFNHALGKFITKTLNRF